MKLLGPLDEARGQKSQSVGPKIKKRKKMAINIVYPST